MMHRNNADRSGQTGNIIVTYDGGRSKKQISSKPDRNSNRPVPQHQATGPKYNTYDFFSSGSYGCTMYPHMKCSGRKVLSSSSQTISKLTLDNAYSQNEFEIGQKLKSIRDTELNTSLDNENSIINHINFVERRCTVNRKKIRVNPSVHYGDCSMLDPKNTRYKRVKNYVLLHMKYIQSEEISKVIYDKHDIKTMLRYYYFILKCIKFLTRHNIVHHDLHLSNTIVDTKGDFHLIDFGIAIDISKCYKSDNETNMNHNEAGRSELNLDYIRSIFITYDPTWGHWPLEYHLCCFILFENSEITEKVISSIVNLYYENNQVFKRNITKMSLFKKEAVEYLKDLVFRKGADFSGEEMVRHILETSWRTWDIYQTNFVVLTLLDLYKIKHLDAIVELCKTGVHFDPANRRDPDYYLRSLMVTLKQYSKFQDAIYEKGNMGFYEEEEDDEIQVDEKLFFDLVVSSKKNQINR